VYTTTKQKKLQGTQYTIIQHHQVMPEWPVHYQPQDLQAGPGTPDISYQEENQGAQPLVKKVRKNRRRKGRQKEQEEVDEEYEASFRAYLAQHMNLCN
jgi:hypothetical protein